LLWERDEEKGKKKKRRGCRMREYESRRSSPRAHPRYHARLRRKRGKRRRRKKGLGEKRGGGKQPGKKGHNAPFLSFLLEGLGQHEEEERGETQKERSNIEQAPMIHPYHLVGKVGREKKARKELKKKREKRRTPILSRLALLFSPYEGQ